MSGDIVVTRAIGVVVPWAQAICEPRPWEGSLILSGLAAPFKVRVLNDNARGLVCLFDMARVDAPLLRSLILARARGGARDPDSLLRSARIEPDRLALVYARSPFVTCFEHVEAAIMAFTTAGVASGLDMAFVARHEGDVDQAITRLHETLTTVMVENLPVLDFFSRFDRPYTVFHMDESLFNHVRDVFLPSFFSRMQGTLLVSLKDASFTASVPGDFHVRCLAVLHGPGGEERHLAVLDRTA